MLLCLKQRAKNQELRTKNQEPKKQQLITIELPTTKNKTMPETNLKKNILKDAIIETIKTIFDPEIAINIYELGLIYEIKIDDDFNAHILMTLTSPNCPVAESLPQEVKKKTQNIQGINKVEVELTFEPPWTQDLLSEEALLELGLL